MSNANETTSVSIVIPVYNEQSCIESTLRELAGVMRRQNRLFEILCVDDGSTDSSGDIIQGLKQQDLPELRLLRLTPNSGQSAAFGAGFRHAVHPIIVTMDADGQNDPNDIPFLLEGLADADVCCGFRHKRQDTASKRIASRIGNRVRNALLGSDIIDTGCSLKVFRAEQVRHLAMLEGMHRFLPNLCAMQGARILQRPVNHRPRTSGTSKYTNFGRLLKTVPDLMAVRWMKHRMRQFRAKEIA